MPSSQERHHNRRLAKTKKKPIMPENHQLCRKIIFLRGSNEEGWKTRQGHGEETPCAVAGRACE